MADIADKWGTRVAERGFAQIPNYLVQINQFLGEDRLSPIELLVLLQLVATWWRKDELPFPSVSTLAARVGVSSRQVQRALNRLEELELLTRVKRRTRGIISSNAYDLAPLVSFLDALAQAFPNAYPRKTAAVAVEGGAQKSRRARKADAKAGAENQTDGQTEKPISS